MNHRVGDGYSGGGSPTPYDAAMSAAMGTAAALSGNVSLLGPEDSSPAASPARRARKASLMTRSEVSAPPVICAHAMCKSMRMEQGEYFSPTGREHEQQQAGGAVAVSWLQLYMLHWFSDR